MNNVSVLQEIYSNQRQNIPQLQLTDEKSWQKNHRFFFLCMIIGLLLGGIPLATIVTIYTKQKYNSSTSNLVLPTNPVLRWNTTGITIAGITNMAGTVNNQLSGPHDVAIDYMNTVYIADSRNNRIQKYVRGSLSGLTIAGDSNGTLGLLSSQLNYPIRVLPKENGDIFIADTNNHRIQFWKNGDATGSTIFGNASGFGGGSTNQLNNPYGITQDSRTNTFYISDSSNNRLLAFQSGNSSVTVISGAWLLVPYGLFFDTRSNSLFISNLLQHNIVQFLLDTNNWTVVAGDPNGSFGNTASLLNNPMDVTLDPMGNIYVADNGNCRIQLFMRGQTNGITIAGITGQGGSNADLLKSATSIKLDNQLNLYVADYDNHRVQKFLRY